jgi:glycine/D-amino acid oxidase-like deaminating enzyme
MTAMHPIHERTEDASAADERTSTRTARPAGDLRPAPTSVEVLVLGAGIAGLATAWHLALAGTKPLVIDPAPTAFAGASGANAAILRTVIEDEIVAELAARGARALTEPDPRLARRSFVDPVGVLLTADGDRAATELERYAAASRTELERLDPVRAIGALPHVGTAATIAYFAARDGTIDLWELRAALVRGIRELGGEFALGRSSMDLTLESGRVTGARLTDGSTVRAGAVVVANGGWAASIANRAGSTVRFEARRRHAALARGLAPVHPRWPVVWNHGDSFYSRPVPGGLMVCHCDQTVVVPAEVAAGSAPSDAVALDSKIVNDLRAATARHLRAPYDDVQLEPWCGLRTFAPDQRFTLGSDPVVAGLAWAAGLGGHGITCGLAAGEVVARSVLGDPDPDFETLAPSRPGAALAPA